ncbi:hypothetical protein SVIOM342S_06905 [Streptomyces violaceorubidus]
MRSVSAPYNQTRRVVSRASTVSYWGEDQPVVPHRRAVRGRGQTHA